MARPIITNWQKPDHTEIYKYRIDLLKKIKEKPELVSAMLNHYRTHWVDFIQDFFVTTDPRVARSSDVTMPFILFPQQVEFVNWVYERWKAKERGLAEKSRDVGLSWCICSCMVCMWLFYPDSVCGCGSQKKEKVDNGVGDPGSLLWKCRKLIETLPAIFVPTNYGENNKWGLIFNPANGSTITGEIGDAIGMGNRTSIYFVDESDALQHQFLAEVSLASTTDCRIDVSTANHVGTIFYNNRRRLPQHQVFIFDWTDDPRKRCNVQYPPNEEPWYQKQLRELPPTVVASQIDRNPGMASELSFVQLELIEDAERRLPGDYKPSPTEPWRIGVDASGMGNDETVIWIRRGKLSIPPITKHKIDGIQLAALIERTIDDLLKIAPVALLAIERDGPGISCSDQLKYGMYARIVRSIHTASRVNDGKCFNLRSWLHYQALQYLKEDQPILPKDPILKMQATSIMSEISRNGLLLIEDKQSYRKRMSGNVSKFAKLAGKSPDRWDAFVLTFTPVIHQPLTQAYDKVKINTSWQPLDPIVGY